MSADVRVGQLDAMRELGHPMPPVIGSLFSGYGGLDDGIRHVLGGDVAWHSEIEPAAARILEHHWPGVPNLGDISAVDWTAVAPVDVLTGGFPCQDVSHAGKRAGIAPGTRSGLWAEMQRAIQALRPALVVAENVRGLLSAKAAGDVECCAWCVGDGEGEPPLRALGAVLGDLAELGYDAWWTGLRAADAGAPHGRFRVFIFAWPADAEGPGLEGAGAFGITAKRSRFTFGGDSAADVRSEARSLGPRLRQGGEAGVWGGRPDDEGASPFEWGDYEPAIRRWEHVTGRVAPAPTEPSTKGQARLSPAFVEWLMGLTPGHVTGVPGVGRNAQLKALGNGVVPQQAALAARMYLAWRDAQVVAA